MNKLAVTLKFRVMASYLLQSNSVAVTGVELICSWTGHLLYMF